MTTVSTCRVNCGHCGALLFVLKGPPAFGSVLDAADLVWPEGVRNGDRVVCPNDGYIGIGDLIPERWAT